MAVDIVVIWPSGKAKYFLFLGLTRFTKIGIGLSVGKIRLIWFGKSGYAQQAGAVASQAGDGCAATVVTSFHRQVKENTMSAATEAQITEWLASQKQAMIGLL